jgi:hypothetical protein
MPIHVDEHANPMNITNHHRECVVTLSAAKGLIGWVARSFAALRMTRPVVLGVVTLSAAKGLIGWVARSFAALRMTTPVVTRSVVTRPVVIGKNHQVLLLYLLFNAVEVAYH